MKTESLTNLITQHDDPVIIWSVALFLLLGGTLLVWPKLRRWYLERQLQKKIRAVAVDSLHQVVIPDGLDGAVYLENLLLTPDGLMVMPVHRYQGIVFAADGIDNWTQVIGKRTYKFANPLPQLEGEVLSLKNYAADIPAQGRVVFTRGVEFPKGRPEKLISVAELEELAEQNRQRDVTPAYWQAWESLKRQVQTAEISELRSLYAIEKEAAFNGRTGLGIVMLLLAGAWLGWHYLPV